MNERVDAESLSDQALMGRMRLGDVEAFCEFFARYEPMLNEIAGQQGSGRRQARALVLDVLYDVAERIRGHRVARIVSLAGYLANALRNRMVDESRVRRIRERQGPARGSWEEHWYDALGRKVLTRARRDSLCEPTSANPCSSYIERTIWDGDQILYELRGKGTDSASAADLNTDVSTLPYDFGKVGYVHAGGIDAPIVLMDTFEGARVPNYNYRGMPESNVWADGSRADCSLPAGGGSTTCTTVTWPSDNVYMIQVNLGPTNRPTWVGSLLANGVGSIGMAYRRNRFYNPATGQFNQQDPIGLAGGANSYGFAGGDPISYSDPFGLSPIGLFAKTVKHVFKRISRERALQSTDNVYVVGRSASGDAKKLAKEKWGNKAVRHDAHDEGQLPHYQHKNGGRGHVFYLERLATVGVSTFGDNIVGQTVDFFNPAADAMAVYEVYDMAQKEIEARKRAQGEDQGGEDAKDKKRKDDP